MRFPTTTELRRAIRRLFPLALAAVLWAPPSRAMLGVRPAREEFVMSPGARTTFAIAVTNPGSKPTDELNCEVSVRNFAMDQGGLPYGTTEPRARSMASWATVTPARFRLAGGATQQLTVTVSAPRDAEGGYYATIETLGTPVAAPANAGGGASIQFGYQANTIVMAVVKGRSLRPDLALRNVELSYSGPDKARMGGWTLRALVEDTGNVHTKVEGSAQLKSMSGALLWRGDLRGGKGTLIPGYPRFFGSAPLPSLPNGRYIASVEFKAAAQRLVMRGAQGFDVAGGKATPIDAKGPLSATSGGLIALPSAVSILGPARARRSTVVALTNTLTRKVSCTLSVSPWRVTADGMAGPCEAKDAPRDASGWVTIRPTTLDLAPGATQKIQVTATIPTGVRGEHYAGILVTPRAEDAAGILPPSVMVTLTPDKTQEPRLLVKSAKVESASASSGPRLAVALQNAGNVRIAPDVNWELLDAKGKRVGEVVPLVGDGAPIFPGATAKWFMPWTRELPPGKYSLKVTAAAEKGQPAVAFAAPLTLPLPKASRAAAPAPRTKAKSPPPAPRSSRR